MANDEVSKTKVVGHAVGRRKEAIATVKLMAGSGDMVINGKPVSQYFPGESAKIKLAQPFSVTQVGKYTVSAKISGGGINGQLDALILGISRALSQVKKEYKNPLRDAGLLTRDSRTRQRRMIGMGGKSRRKKQSPKR